MGPNELQAAFYNLTMAIAKTYGSVPKEFSQEMMALDSLINRLVVTEVVEKESFDANEIEKSRE